MLAEYDRLDIFIKGISSPCIKHRKLVMLSDLLEISQTAQNCSHHSRIKRSKLIILTKFLLGSLAASLIRDKLPTNTKTNASFNIFDRNAAVGSFSSKNDWMSLNDLCCCQDKYRSISWKMDFTHRDWTILRSLWFHLKPERRNTRKPSRLDKISIYVLQPITKSLNC